MTARVDHEPDAVGSSHELAMLRAAELYYYGRLTHAQIAEQLATSRWTVGRLLEQAREVGIVRIIIEHPLARHHQLEVELRKQFGVRDALVVPGQADSSVTMQAVCRAAAQYLTALRPRPSVLGVSWGRTTSRVATAVSDGWNPGVTVVQTNGGLAMDGTGWSGIRVAKMTPSSSSAFMPAWSSACCAAMAAREVADSSSAI